MYYNVSRRFYCHWKEVRNTEEQVLFSTLLNQYMNQYQFCRKLGTGRSGTVFLTYHRELEEYRAVKAVPKTIADYETFRREALFLKDLRHPGIPLVYEVLCTEPYSFLILEYLEIISSVHSPN